MSHVLVVKEAVGDLRRGDTVTDPDKIKALEESHPGHFVKRPAHQHELIAMDAAAEKAKAEAAKPKTSKGKE